MSRFAYGPVWIAAEVGINHNGDLATALELITEAARAGADAVKFQVGDPTLYVNRDRWSVPRETPWGVIPYIEYRKRMELSDADLAACKLHAQGLGLEWFASPLDITAVPRLERLGVQVHKMASPMLTNAALLRSLRETGKPVIVSSGMSTLQEIDRAVASLGPGQVAALLHCTSAYPCPPELCNLRMIPTLQARYPNTPIGYSGHETGLTETFGAVALGARVVERHLTLSRAMWGSDHAASLEPHGLQSLVRGIRTMEHALGDGQKRVYDAERVNMGKFRAPTPEAAA